MAMVRFATTCDLCGTRGEEYSAYPHCRECGKDVCPDCQVTGTATEDEQNECLCWECNVCPLCEGAGGREVPVSWNMTQGEVYETRWEPCPECGEGE